ncbi:MAG: ABC transporter ATP-binding protein [Ruminococcaceae bacterium]|nr:ABC transporter ATP-binding protein [Oscillospiraceae bacterium]
MKWILKKARNIWPGILLLVILGTMTSLLGVFFALFSKQVLDIATGQSDGNLLRAAFFLSLLLLLELGLEILLSFTTVHVTGRFGIRLKTDLFSAILKKDYMRITAFHSGELLNRISSDAGIITNGLVQLLPNLIFYLTKIAAVFFALFMLDADFAKLCLILGPMIFLTALLYRKRMKALHKSTQAADGRVKAFMLEALQNLPVIKSFGRSEAAAAKSKQLQHEHFKLSLSRNRISILANVFYFIALTAGYYVALAWGAYKISLGLMTFGTLTALLQLVGQIQTPIQGMSSLLPQLYAMLASAERLQELEQLPADSLQTEAAADISEWSSIRLQDISFSYQEENVLCHLDFHINRGEFLVITGTSGTGKSTLLKVLLGIVSPQSGKRSLLLTDDNELPLTKAGNALFAYVPQGNLIVSGTIRDNIAFFNSEAKEDDIIQAAKTAQIWDFISTLPEGLDTPLGENGLGLSEGQSQRLAVARAVLFDAPVLLLDEATSALDEETELAILTALKSQKDKTCILVSHKKAALSFCDRVIRFENDSPETEA